MMFDFFEGDLQELTKRLAYENWERRGRPLGSPEIDWFAAKKNWPQLWGKRKEGFL